MRFYFPDSQDLVSPTYDFMRDEYSPYRVRQRDDRYAHEVLRVRPYDGILVSKTIVDGSVHGAGKYSVPQQARLYRLGVRAFFRLPTDVEALGDNGAFNYINERIPPVTVDQVLDFYDGCGFDAGISVDHVIFGYQRDVTLGTVDPEWAERRLMTLRLAERFLAAVHARASNIRPLGAAQGWSPASYADSVKQLQSMGYQSVALGGMVPLKTRDILECLAAIDVVRHPTTELHLLGISRVDSMELFAEFGVTSFDSTSPFRQSFMDDKNNYHTPAGAYVAVRVPQVEGNPTLKRNILAGLVSQREAVEAERTSLKALRAYDTGQEDLAAVLETLGQYEKVVCSKASYLDSYERTLQAQPWKNCRCQLCRDFGVEIIIFRGTERNKRRGFHNLSVLATKMSQLPKLSLAHPRSHNG